METKKKKSMKQKLRECVKGSTWIKILLKKSCLQIVTIQVIFTLLVAFFILILGTFVNWRLRKFIVRENTQRMLMNYCGSENVRLKDWIAPREAWHSMSDQELIWRASMVNQVKDYPYNRTPKVAFMFLTKNILPLAPLWELFFKGHQRLFSIYVHVSSDKFVDEPLPSSVFYKRRIPRQPVEWGKPNMVDAERRLLANALLDFSNERFILLSESCIPLFNFTTIYNYLINSNQSFIGSIDDPRPFARGRYNKLMSPTILISDWRKGNQWFEVQRQLAILIISDLKFYPVFKRHCLPPCYMDEHYIPTLITKFAYNFNSNRSVTWVEWPKPGPHPRKFLGKDVSEDLLNRIRNRTDCVYNRFNGSYCFLFARKFHPTSLDPLLNIAPRLFQF